MLLLVFTILIRGEALAQSPYLYVGNKYVTAEVHQQSGVISIYTTPFGYYGRDPKILTYPKTSYLTLNINERIFTNNDKGQGWQSDPRLAGYLMNGSSRYIRGIQAPYGTGADGQQSFGPQDTVETIWRLPFGDLTQQVYPVAFDFSGQIIIKWKFRSRSGSPLRIQAQYLLDTKIRTNDRAKVLTRAGYKRMWSMFVENNPNYPPVPAWYQAFQQDLEPPTFDPILASQGTFISPELGLMRPDAVVVGDWENLIDLLWGLPNVIPPEEYGDSAVLMLFPAAGALTGQTVELGRTAYGTGEFESCTGDLYALIYRPRVLRSNATGDDYKPNPFDVQMFLFNTHPFTEANYTEVTMEVGPHLKIVAPSGAINGGTMQTQWASPRIVAVQGVSIAEWKVKAEKTCDNDTTWMQFTSKSTLNDPSFNQTCRLPLHIPCLDKDTLPPIAEPVVSVGFTKTIEFHDDRLKDKGIQKIEAYGYNQAKFTARVDAFQPCTRQWVKVTMQQLDSLVDGCIQLRVTDCAGNITNQEVCFPKYPLNPDTVAPRITLIGRNITYDGSECNAKFDTLLAVDDDKTVFDRGLETITYTPGYTPVNMELVVSPITWGSERHGFSVRVLDSMVDGRISVRATDVDGNFSDYELTYCTFPDTNRPLVTISQLDPYTWSVFVEDGRPYDRLLDTIEVYNRQNVTLTQNGYPFEPTRDLTRWQSTFSFNVHVTDTLKFASFCVRAKDLADSSSLAQSAKWWSEQPNCSDRDTLTDVWAPNITLNPSPFVSPTEIDVTIDDIHYFSGQRIGWDKGIDSIWFTNVKGMVVPATIIGQCKDSYTFRVSVSDTLALDSTATICVNAIDCAGNRVDTCWQYPIISDTLPPIIRGIRASIQQLDMVITDSTTYDRGLRKITLQDHDNFEDVDLINASGRVLELPLIVKDTRKSAVGRLEAIDVYGALATSAPIREEHTSYIDVAVWAQDLAFKNSTLADQNMDIPIAIRFVENDTFSLYRKDIREFEIVFELEGDPAFSYAGFDLVGTAAESFTVLENVAGNRITLHGVSDKPLMLSDTDLLRVVIHSGPSEVTRMATLKTISVVFNAGRDTLVRGKNSYAYLPAPHGSISGGTIVAAGSCAPSLVAGVGASKPILEPIYPNPIGKDATIPYWLPAEGEVTIVVLNALGQEVQRLVDDVQTAGFHSVVLSTDALGQGAYYVRLESSGKVETKKIHVSK